MSYTTVTMSDCARHRDALRRSLPDGLILLAGGAEVPRNNDVHYVFRQLSDFLYLTGVPEPGYALLLDPRRGCDTLFIPKVDADHRVWLGHVPDPTEAKARFGFMRARYIDELPRTIERARSGYRACYSNLATWSRYRTALRGLKPGRARLLDALQELRAVKSSGEVELLRRAGEISARGHLAVMAAARPGMQEYELQAVFESTCLKSGLRHQGYPPIVAAGRNAAVLHYRDNDDLIKDGDLLLVDAGGECDGYSADITRTFPSNGRFTRRQRDVYAIVLEAQKRCIERSKAGVLSGELHLYSMSVIAEGLRSLGLLRGSTEDLVASGAVRLFYPHGLTHMLGLDVHDSMGGRRRQVPSPPNIRLRFNARLEPGFVITMEPGIYFNEALIHDKERRSKLRRQVNFDKVERFLDFGGVRIEDDIVIRPSGPPSNLTPVPKEIEALESALRR